MKKLTKTELINALCAVQLEHAKKKRDELNWRLIENKGDVILRLLDFFECLCSDNLKLDNFIHDNYDVLIRCKLDDEALKSKIKDRVTIATKYARVSDQIDCPNIIKEHVTYLRDPTMTVTIEDGQTIYDNETLEAERKRIFGD